MHYSLTDSGERRDWLPEVKRVVIKVGTQLLRATAKQDSDQRIAALIDEIALLRQAGREVILVSSGAVGFGMATLGTVARPRTIAGLQAHAAVGQCHLMSCYEKACERLGFHCAQLLLTAADLHDLERNRHVTQCLHALLEAGVLPVVNENDSVCVDEIKVGDNDTLAAYVATMLRADLTILLTTVEAMHETSPESSELGQRISVVHEITPALLRMAQGTDGNPYSVGGMATKLRAAQIVSTSGEAMIIAGGKDFGRLGQIFRGEDVGTLFLPGRRSRMRDRQRFLAFFSEPTGDLILDAGAEQALCRQHRSLLAGGLLGITGQFHRGDTVRLLNAERRELGRGIVNFAFDEVARICGAKSDELPRRLGREVESPEVVHKDYLVLTP